MITKTDFSILDELATAFQAFADPQRLKIVRILASRTKESLSVTDVSKTLGITQSAASQHIKTLKLTGLLNVTRDGNRRIYTINYDAVFRFKEIFDDLYGKAFTLCPYAMNCKECPVRKTCG